MATVFSESPRLSADYLRKALPLMTKLGVAVNPANYAVFYTYVAGKNPELKDEVDRLLESGERLTRSRSEQLFKKYFAEFDPTEAEQFQRRTRRILTQILKAIVAADNDASQYDSALDAYSSRLDEDVDEKTLQEIIEGVLNDTRGMRRSYQNLQEKLNATTHEVESLRKELEKARRQALLDPLTGLENRASFVDAMQEALQEAASHAHPPCLLMLDIDHFKRVNDTYGHPFGDSVLKLVGSILQKGIKGKDTASRYGGEEFAVLLPDTPLEGAGRLAENIRATLEKGHIQKTGSKEVVGNITISIGVTRYRAGETAETFIERADAALYASKHAGRNRVTITE